jgi:hypothetical protein
MAEQKVRIRYLGKSLLKGNPKREFINVAGEKFWNCRRFPEQNDDLSYTRPMKFYLDNQDILSDRKLFIVEIVQDVPAPKVIGAPVITEEKASILTEDLEDTGVIEVDGVLCCPFCDYTIDNPSPMRVHLKTEHAGRV